MAYASYQIINQFSTIIMNNECIISNIMSHNAQMKDKYKVLKFEFILFCSIILITVKGLISIVRSINDNN